MSRYPITSAYEEKAILGKVGIKFTTKESQEKLKLFRIQQRLGNRILFSTLWKDNPRLLMELDERVEDAIFGSH